MQRTAATAWVLIAATAVLAAEPASRPAGFTQHDWVEGVTKFNRRTLVDAYDANGVHDKAWNGNAKAFLERVSVRFAQAGRDAVYRTDAGIDDDTMVGLSDELKACRDPLVNYCRAIIYRDAEQTEASAELMAKWAPKLVAGNYPPVRRYFAAAALAKLKPQDKALAKQRDDLVLPMLAAPMADPFERRRMFDIMIDDVWTDNGQREHKSAERGLFVDALAAQNGDPWLVDMLRGVNHINAAWEARGSGWANTVSEDGWKGFQANIAKARELFERVYASEPAYPEAASHMLTVCMAESGSDDEARYWFDRAIAAQIDHMDAWSRYSSCIQPRWGGSLETMQALAKEAVETKRFDTEVPFYVTDVIGQMAREPGSSDAVYRRPGVWELIRQAQDGYLKEAADKINVPWVTTRRAGFAWKCGQYAEALKTLDALGPKLDARALVWFKIDADELRSECRAMSGQFAKAMQRAEFLERAGNYHGARTEYDRVLKTVAADDADRPYYVRRRGLASLAADLKTIGSAVVPLASADDLLPWKGDVSAWQLKDGVLTFAGPARAEATLIHRTLLPAQTRFTVEWSYSVPKAGVGPGVDVLIQDTQREGRIAVQTYASDNTVVIGMGKYGLTRLTPDKAPIEFKPDTWHTMEIEHAGNTLTVRQDGKTILENFENGWLAHGQASFGLRGHMSSSDGEVRVRNIKLEAIR